MRRICDNIIGTLLKIEEKTKDNLNSYLDLQAMGIRKQLHPIWKGTRILQDFWWLFFKCISMCETQWKEYVRAKIAWFHVLMQQRLPISICEVFNKDVCEAIIKLPNFFKQLCSKVLTTYQLQRLENDIVVILCKLEQIFSP